MTKEELFLCKLHAISLKKSDPYQEINRYEVGRALGYHDRSVDNIVQILTQTNFIKKIGDQMIVLTPHGYKLVCLLEKNK